MAIANDIIFLALRNAGVTGVGQTPAAEDANDSFVILNAMIGQWNLERRVMANPVTCPTFPDLTTNLAFWDPYLHLLLTAMAVRLREIYSLAPVELDVKIAADAIQKFQAINAQQIAPPHPGVPTTCLQIIWLALRMAGRINDQQLVTDTSKDVDDAMSQLVGMIAQWQKKRWLVYVEQTVSVPTSTGAQSYTIGPGQDFDCARPDHVTAAYIRINGGSPPNLVDIPLEVIESQEDWSQITVKTLETMPYAVWYESTWPTGLLHFWPVPPASMYGLFVVVKAPLPTYASTADVMNLPPEYQDAVVANLACRIMALNGQTPPAFLMGLSRMTLDTLRNANAQIATLAVPAPLGRLRTDLSLVGRGLGRAFILGQGAVL